MITPNIPKLKIKKFYLWHTKFKPGLASSLSHSNSLIDSSANVLKICKEEGVKTSAAAVNLTLYTAVLLRDLCCLLSRLWWSHDDCERNMLCRSISLAVVEGLEDIVELNAELLRDLPPESGLRNSIMHSSILLNGMRKKHDAQLRKLRITATAHRDKNAILLLQAIQEVDTSAVELLGWEMFIALQEVLGTLNEVINTGCDLCRHNRSQSL